MKRLARAIAALCLLTGGSAWAQVGSVQAAEAAGARGLVRAGEPENAGTHAWVTIPGETGVQLVHVPPRDGAESPAEAGTIRPARSLLESPVAMAGVGDRVYLVFDPAESPSGPIRRVLTVRSVPAGVQGVWTELPMGVFDLAPSLPGTGTLLGLAVGRGSVHALLREGDALELLRMGASSWSPVRLPTGLDPDRVALVSHADGVLVATQDADGDSLAWADSKDAGWTRTAMSDWDRFWSADWRRGVGREVVVGVPEGEGSWGVWSIGASDSWRITEVPAPAGRTPAVAVVGPVGRIVVVDRDEAGAVLVTERSLTTGRSIYEGPALRRSPVSADEFRMIAAMLMAVMVASLLVIIRPSGERPWTVPDGWVLAEGSRRLLATVVDVLLMVWIVAPAFGATVREVVTMQVLVLPERSWLVVPACLVGGAAAMGVWEGLLGFSPGKLLCGLRVYRAEAGEPQKLGIFWGLVRSTVKWMIPPVAALALVEPTGRHRGDASARAVVVARAGIPEPDGAEG